MPGDVQAAARTYGFAAVVLAALAAVTLVVAVLCLAGSAALYSVLGELPRVANGAG